MANRLQRFWGIRRLRIGAAYILLPLVLAGCTSTSTTTATGKKAQAQPPGFFDRVADQMSERQCNVGKFICPYGFGPAGEACDCTDPSGFVLKGRTVK
jgi:hypothetical protein